MAYSGRKTKVVHFSTVHALHDTRMFYAECRSLAKAGYEVVVIVPHERDEVVQGIRVRALPRPRSRIERITRTAWAAFRAALEEKADIYHFHDPELVPVGKLLSWQGKRVIYDMHENTPKQILRKYYIRPWIRRPLAAALRLTERVLLPGIPVVFAETSYEKDYPWVKRHTTVLNMPFAKELAQIAKGITKREKPTVGYMGEVSEERGSLVTLEALRILKERGIDVNFECVGPIRQKAHGVFLRDFCRKYGLTGVTFHGFRPPEEGWRIIAACHIGLAVLKPIPNFVGSYPTKMFEYMAMGLPVIVSDFPLYREVVERKECGMVIDPGDPRACAEAVEGMVRYADKALAMGTSGRKAVDEEYNWELEAGALLEFYKEVTSGPERRGRRLGAV